MKKVNPENRKYNYTKPCMKPISIVPEGCLLGISGVGVSEEEVDTNGEGL